MMNSHHYRGLWLSSVKQLRTQSSISSFILSSRESLRSLSLSSIKNCSMKTNSSEIMIKFLTIEKYLMAVCCF